MAVGLFEASAAAPAAAAVAGAARSPAYDKTSASLALAMASAAGSPVLLATVGVARYAWRAPGRSPLGGGAPPEASRAAAATGLDAPPAMAMPRPARLRAAARRPSIQ